MVILFTIFFLTKNNFWYAIVKIHSMCTILIKETVPCLSRLFHEYGEKVLDKSYQICRHRYGNVKLLWLFHF
jgi:hypothetical protein